MTSARGVFDLVPGNPACCSLVDGVDFSSLFVYIFLCGYCLGLVLILKGVFST